MFKVKKTLCAVLAGVLLVVMMGVAYAENKEDEDYLKPVYPEPSIDKGGANAETHPWLSCKGEQEGRAALVQDDGWAKYGR
jgi:hypothetical protein